MKEEKDILASRISKIVCFDEESITDYVQIVAGGELEKTTQLLNTRDAEESQGISGKAKAGIGGVFKALLGWEASAEGQISAELTFNSNKMIKNIVKNTILTDFLAIVEKKSSAGSRVKKGAINKFKGYKISVEKDSLSYMVMVSPYLKLFQSGSIIPAGEFDIAVDKLDSVLRKAKGYYEFIGVKKDRKKVVFRFNINSFKNNYSISDLLKMDLSIYAVKVGKTTLDMLNVNNELDMSVPSMATDNPSYVEEEDNKININEDLQMDVFDVLLAGVEVDD